MARKKGVAGNEMCTFLIINISSLQLNPRQCDRIPSQYGSADPAGIIGAGIVATAVSTGVAAVFCKLMDKRRKNTDKSKEFPVAAIPPAMLQ